MMLIASKDPKEGQVDDREQDIEARNDSEVPKTETLGKMDEQGIETLSNFEEQGTETPCILDEQGTQTPNKVNMQGT